MHGITHKIHTVDSLYYAHPIIHCWILLCRYDIRGIPASHQLTGISPRYLNLVNKVHSLPQDTEDANRFIHPRQPHIPLRFSARVHRMLVCPRIAIYLPDQAIWKKVLTLVMLTSSVTCVPATVPVVPVWPLWTNRDREPRKGPAHIRTSGGNHSTMPLRALRREMLPEETPTRVWNLSHHESQKLSTLKMFRISCSWWSWFYGPFCTDISIFHETWKVDNKWSWLVVNNVM